MNAVATLLYDPLYLPGALVLGDIVSRLAPANTDLVVLIDKLAFTQQHLQLLAKFWKLVDIKVLESHLTETLHNDLRRPELAKTFSKIHLWNLPYDKVLYLDADTLPLEENGNVVDLLKLDFAPGSILAAPDSGFPDIFNSGVFVLSPNDTDYRNLLSLGLSRGSDISFDGADQGLLNQYFNGNPDWVSEALESGVTDVAKAPAATLSKWIKIPFFYNTTPNAQYQYGPAFNHFTHAGSLELSGAEAGDASELAGSANPSTEFILETSYYGNTAHNHFATSAIKVMHFIGPNKPWRNEHNPVFERWWRLWSRYSDGSHEGLVGRSVVAQALAGLTIKVLPDDETVVRVATEVKSEGDYTPVDLCDPLNYQQFASNLRSMLSVWDATRELPPSEKPPPADFQEEVDHFENEWDTEDEPIEAHDDGPAEEAYSEQEDAQPTAHGRRALKPGAGYHPDQRPERVFDSTTDYMPRHLLMQRRQLREAERDTDDEESELMRQLVEELEIENTEEGLMSSHERHSSLGHQYRPQSRPVRESVSKIFPWEFRDQPAPQRVWNTDE